MIPLCSGLHNERGVLIMARYNSTITSYGSQLLTGLIALGEPLTLTRAAVGDGIPGKSPEEMTALVSPRSDIQVSMGEKTVVEGSPAMICIPVQTSNRDLTVTRYVREIGLFAASGDSEVLFAYCWLEGDDIDNAMGVSGLPGEADTIQLHDVGLFVTNQEAEAIHVQMSGGTFVSRSFVETYAAPKAHIHQAQEITESTGESVEIAQRRQDYDIAAMKEQLDTGFTGTTLTHTVAASELEQWTGYSGSGYPEGIYDKNTERLYA